MNEPETFKSESQMLLRVRWLVENSFKVTVFYDTGKDGNRLYFVSSYSMI